MNPSTAFARVLVDELLRGGVTDAVLAPGSRSAPVALALAAAERDGRHDLGQHRRRGTPGRAEESELPGHGRQAYVPARTRLGA